MIQIYNMSHRKEWDEIIKTFPQYDIYYTSGYVRAFEIKGDGEPQLIYYEDNGLRAAYVYLKRKTDIEQTYDSISPYGYGGVIFDGDTKDYKIKEFWKSYLAKMAEENIIDNFVRYHPVIDNASLMTKTSEVINLGKTISLDLASQEIIWNNITSKNRTHIRKAEKNGIIIKHGKGMELFREFMVIYNETMKQDNAEEYYYFNEDFYESIDKDLKDNYEMFWAEYEGKKIAMSIMIFANGHLNYHLSGSMREYRNLAPSNLLLYKAAIWGCEQGMKTFHLGGGVGSEEDNLYKFKAAFNRNSNCHFAISKMIFDKEKYNALVKKRQKEDTNFNPESSYFPLYRS